VHPGHKMSTHYFSCSGGSGVEPVHVFCIRITMQITDCILVCSGHETLTHYFLCLGGPGADPIKSTLGYITGTCVFASGAICVSCSAFWCIRGTKYRCTIFRARMGKVRIPLEARRDKLLCTCIFASGAICGSHSASVCVRGMKH
jgi:hypothetical protein